MKNRPLTFLVFALLGSLFIPAISSAHPGKTDAYGCHTCRTNCPSWGLSYGEYHCHRAKALPQPEEPIKSHLNKGGTGYTEPAPEYKIPAKNLEIPTSQKQETSSKEGWFRKLLRRFRL